NVVALGLEQRGRHRRVDAARHGDDDAGVLRRALEIETVKHPVWRPTRRTLLGWVRPSGPTWAENSPHIRRVPASFRFARCVNVTLYYKKRPRRRNGPGTGPTQPPLPAVLAGWAGRACPITS